MIDAGTTFCPTCGSVHTQAYYRTGSRSQGVILYRQNKRFFVTPVADPNNPDENPVNVTLKSISTDASDGLPDHIDVEFEDTKETYFMSRYCPHCYDRVKYPDMGKYRTFIIAMVGDRSSGKSAWLNSTSYPQNIQQILDAQYSKILDILPFANVRKKAEATDILGRGMTKLVSIKDAETRNTIAHVILLDVSGELFNNPDPNLVSPEYIWKLLSGFGGYPGADAFMFIERNPMLDTLEPSHLEFSAAKIYDQCLKEGIFTHKPLAYVYTHLDTVLASNKLPVYKKDNGRTIPLMTQNTFQKNASYAPDALIARIYTEDSIARSFNHHALITRLQHNTRGFLVQSCSTHNGSDGSIIEEYSDRINVLDPLLWILNRLQIFPLKKGGTP